MSSTEVPHIEPTPTAPVVWSEPTRALPLRWGSYWVRYFVGFGLLILAPIAAYLVALLEALIPEDYNEYVDPTTFGSANFLIQFGALVLFVLLTTAAFVTFPSTILRRVLALVLMLLAVVITLSAGFGSVFALASWLVLRMRSGLSYLLLIGVLIADAIGRIIALFGLYSWGITFITVVWVTSVVGLSWVAVAISRAQARSRATSQ
jgi:hypothetical protein